MKNLKFNGQIVSRKTAAGRFQWTVIRRPKFGGGLQEYPEEEEDARLWLHEYWKKVIAKPYKYILVTPLAEVEAVTTYGQKHAGIITEVGSYHSHMAKVARETFLDEVGSRQVAIVGAKGIYQHVRTGDEIEVVLNEDGSATINLVKPK